MNRLFLPAIVLGATLMPNISNANDERRPLPRMFGRAAAIAVDQLFNIPWNVQVNTESRVGEKRSSVNVSVKTDSHSQSNDPSVGRQVHVQVNTSQSVQPPTTPAPTVYHAPAPARRNCYPCYPRRVVYGR